MRAACQVDLSYTAPHVLYFAVVLKPHRPVGIVGTPEYRTFSHPTEVLQ
jgi:hypothetical protein